MPLKKVKKQTKNGTLFVFYDFECYQNKAFARDSEKFEHEVMLCVAQQTCSECYDVDTDSCENCGVREHLFVKENVVKEFMQYLGSLDDKFKQIVAIAHNGQKYDAHFILKYMYKHCSEWPLREESLIMNGTKILRIQMRR